MKNKLITLGCVLFFCSIAYAITKHQESYTHVVNENAIIIEDNAVMINFGATEEEAQAAIDKWLELKK